MSNGFDVFKDGWDGVACCFPASSVRSYASFFPAVSTLETPTCFHQKWPPPAEDIFTGWLKKGQVWVCDRPTLCPRGRFFSPSGPHSSSKGCPPQLPSPLGSFHPFALHVLNKQSASWSHLSHPGITHGSRAHPQFGGSGSEGRLRLEHGFSMAAYLQPAEHANSKQAEWVAAPSGTRVQMDLAVFHHKILGFNISRLFRGKIIFQCQDGECKGRSSSWCQCS